MRYFSGFCFFDEEEIFSDFIDEGVYNVVGFSYGAQRALEFVRDEIKNGKRVAKLQLLSPAFFNNKSSSFKRTQIVGFNKNSRIYIDKFLESCGVDYTNIDSYRRYIKDGDIDELKSLLGYTWDEGVLKKIADKGVEIEVFLGDMDEIIDAWEVMEFFKNSSIVYLLKKRNHLLREVNRLDKNI